MAPPRLHATPLEQLGRLLRDARARGLSFEDAWEAVVRPERATVLTNSPAAPAEALRWPTDTTDRLSWQRVIADTREMWRKAYEQLPPSPGEKALVHLAEAFSRVDEGLLRRLAEGIRDGDAVRSAA